MQVRKLKIIISLQQGKLFVRVKLETMHSIQWSPSEKSCGMLPVKVGQDCKMVHTQWQDKHLADLAIATDLNFLVVIPWIYQMMSLLEWNISSVEEKKL